MAVFRAFRKQWPRNSKEWLWLTILSNLADFDFFLYYLPASAQVGHHAQTHSLGFSLIITSGIFIMHILSVGFTKKLIGDITPIMVFYLLSSHLVIDLFTIDSSAERGIWIFWPVSNENFLSPVTFFPGVHHGSFEKLASLQNIRTALLEFVIWLPVLFLVGRFSNPSDKLNMDL